MARGPHKYASKSAIQRARDLRDAATDAESLMWRHLRNNSLGAKFRRQHPFERYVLDFYCHEADLVIEIDGGQHFEPEHEARDAARTRVLESAGLHVLRFTNLEVMRELEAVLQSVWSELEVRLPSP